ncbi:MAG TPA: sigma-70 family RNA polymerase sigma factor, partial [Acidimicrobiales bacterium]|nr:sigma-70 family RNA polymerase sigma factor [Acidimicrobiales bacterium]
DLVEALSRLTADQREVVVLRFVADLPLADVARITGRRTGAVKALQHRALEALSALLDRPPPAAEPSPADRTVPTPPVS